MLTEYRLESLIKKEALILESIYCELFVTGVLLKDELAMLLILLSRGNVGTGELKMRLKCGLPAIKATRKSLEAISIMRLISDRKNLAPRAVLILPTLSLRNDDFNRDACLSRMSKLAIENRIKYDEKNYDTNLIVDQSNNNLDASVYIKNFFKRVEEISTIENNPSSLIVSHPIINYNLPTKEDPNFWWHVNANSIKVKKQRDTDDPLDSREYRNVIKAVESYMGKNSIDIFREKWRELHKEKEKYANLIFYNKEANDRFGKGFNMLATKKQEEVMEKCKKMYINYDEPEYQEHQKYGIEFTPFTDSDYIDMVNYFGEIPLDIYQKITSITRDEDKWKPVDRIIEEWKISKAKTAEMPEYKEEEVEEIPEGFSFLSSCQTELEEFNFEENFIKNVDKKINHREFIEIYGGDAAEYVGQIFAILKDCEDRGKTPEESIEEIREIFINE